MRNGGRGRVKLHLNKNREDDGEIKANQPAVLTSDDVRPRLLAESLRQLTEAGQNDPSEMLTA